MAKRTVRSSASYDPWDAAALADPYPFYEELREDGGCHELPELDMWVLSSYEFVSGALRDHVSFSSVGGVSRQPTDDMPGWISEDPPSHTATRALAMPVFRRSAMSAHSATVRLSTERAVQRFVAAGGGDVVSKFAEPVALDGLCSILGIPNESPDAMVAMSEATFVGISARSVEDRPAGIEKLRYAVGIPFSRLIEAQLERHVPDPTASLLDMITAHAGDDAGFVTLDELGRAVYLTTLVAPGIETTRSMIANAVDLAALHPDIWAAVRAGDISASAFVNEVLRFESPVQGFFRAASRTIDIGSHTIPAGARVLCLYGSANRDESVFDQADLFRPGRPNVNRHLAYGAGIHRCIGASLAETEGVAAIEALAATVKRFEVTRASRRTDMAQLRSFATLEVSVSVDG